MCLIIFTEFYFGFSDWYLIMLQNFTEINFSQTVNAENKPDHGMWLMWMVTVCQCSPLHEEGCMIPFGQRSGNACIFCARGVCVNEDGFVYSLMIMAMIEYNLYC